MLNKYTLLGIVSCLSINIFSMDSTLTKFNKSAVFASHKLGDIDLYHGQDGFIVNKDGKNHKIQSCFVDKSLRNLNKKQLDVLQKVAKFEVKKFNNSDDYTIKLNQRGLGGGPLAGWLTYWGTKATGVAAYTGLVWITHGEALLHVNEAAVIIEATATAAAAAATALPTP